VDGYGVVTVSKDVSGRITVSFPYDPLRVQKIKTIEGRKWHKDKKYCSFPDLDWTLAKILRVFEGEKINIDPALQAKLPTHVIAIPTEGREKQSQFEDLRKELVACEKANIRKDISVPCYSWHGKIIFTKGIGCQNKYGKCP